MGLARLLLPTSTHSYYRHHSPATQGYYHHDHLFTHNYYNHQHPSTPKGNIYIVVEAKTEQTVCAPQGDGIQL